MGRGASEMYREEMQKVQSLEIKDRQDAGRYNRKMH